LLNLFTVLPDELNPEWKLHLTRHLQLTKESFIQKEIFAALTVSFADQITLKKPNKPFIRSVLQLIFNTLSIPSLKPNSDHHVILALEKNRFIEIFVTCIQKYGKEFKNLYIGIISLMLKDQTPSSLLHDSYSVTSSGVKINKPNPQTKEVFREIMLEEKAAKQNKMTINRHSRFGGVIVQNRDEDPIVHQLVDGKPVTRSYKTNRNFKINKPHQIEKTTFSPPEVKLALKKFVEEFRMDCANGKYFKCLKISQISFILFSLKLGIQTLIRNITLFMFYISFSSTIDC
jgi:hypothetical protein